jgi:type II secretory pathway pseudopilin PulG
MRLKRKILKNKAIFTLLELMFAMGIFSLIMAVLFRFIDIAQKAWTDSSNRSMVYENARLAFDLIARDLQSSYYSEDAIPFWHKADTGASWNENRNESLSFISTTNTPPYDNCDSKFYEVKYQLYYATSHTDSNEGWLMRSVTGDHIDPADGGGANSKWNYLENFNVSYGTASSAFTGDDASSDSYSGVIPYVVDLSFVCLRRDGTEITADATGINSTDFPSSVIASITLMDRFSFKKWQALDAAGAANKDIFKADNSSTFRKTFFLGEKGQND